MIRRTSPPTWFLFSLSVVDVHIHTYIYIYIFIYKRSTAVRTPISLVLRTYTWNLRLLVLFSPCAPINCPRLSIVHHSLRQCGAREGSEVLFMVDERARREILDFYASISRSSVFHISLWTLWNIENYLNIISRRGKWRSIFSLRISPFTRSSRKSKIHRGVKKHLSIRSEKLRDTATAFIASY